MDIFIGFPSKENTPKGQAVMHITDIFRYEHFEPQVDYPEAAKYFIYGNRRDYVVNVNVTDTILWQGHHDRVMQLN